MWSRRQSGTGEGLVKDGFEEAAALGLGGGELRFQAVAEGHQLVDFGDDAVLFGEGGRRIGMSATNLVLKCVSATPTAPTLM